MKDKVLAVPVSTDSDGVRRIGLSRVTLDAVIESFTEGATPEQIVNQYKSLDLADVYAVIGYYLRNAHEVEAYLRVRRVHSSQQRAEKLLQSQPAPLHKEL